MYSKLPRKPNVELIFYSGLQFFGFSSSSFTKSAEFVSLPGKASLVSIRSIFCFHLWGSPTSMSLACLLSVTLEIEFRGKRGVGMRTMGPGLRCHLVPPPILCIILYGG